MSNWMLENLLIGIYFVLKLHFKNNSEIKKIQISIFLFYLSLKYIFKKRQCIFILVLFMIIF